ncbi:MAG: hypothetical protein EXR07_03265 [Acetobacteraceae bacterium]|nr:hypothetical protein [Acetobacteraceae bacterium]
MSAILDPLVTDLVDWVAAQPRPYDEVMDAWRTSCPRLTVWEDAIDRGLVAHQGRMVAATPAGLRFLEARGRRSR